MAGAAGFDWPALMRLGLGRLGLDPVRFWALTPMELVIRLGLDGDGRAAMDRDRLEELARAFPDREKGDSTGDRNG